MAIGYGYSNRSDRYRHMPSLNLKNYYGKTRNMEINHSNNHHHPYGHWHKHWGDELYVTSSDELRAMSYEL